MPFGEAPLDDMKFQGARDNARDIAAKWANPTTKKQVDIQLSKRGLNPDSIFATSFAMHVGSLEAAERILCALELRRNRTLKEIEDRRQSRNLEAFEANNWVK